MKINKEIILKYPNSDGTITKSTGNYIERFIPCGKKIIDREWCCGQCNKLYFEELGNINKKYNLGRDVLCPNCTTKTTYQRTRSNRSKIDPGNLLRVAWK